MPEALSSKGYPQLPRVNLTVLKLNFYPFLRVCIWSFNSKFCSCHWYLCPGVFTESISVNLIPSPPWYDLSPTHPILLKAPVPCYGQYLFLLLCLVCYSSFLTTHLLFLLAHFLSSEVIQFFLQKPVSSFMFYSWSYSIGHLLPQRSVQSSSQ